MRHSPPTPLDMLIVGAGFAGLYMLHQARALGLQALVVDAAHSVGGTWFHNRHPGARVDIQSLEYSFSFDEDLQQQWPRTERYAAQPELLRYANHVADRFALRDGILLRTRLAGARYDEADQSRSTMPAFVPATGACGWALAPSSRAMQRRRWTPRRPSGRRPARQRWPVSATQMAGRPAEPAGPDGGGIPEPVPHCRHRQPGCIRQRADAGRQRAGQCARPAMPIQTAPR